MLSQADVFSLAKIFHLTLREVCAIVRDDVVWKAKAEDNLFEKLNRRSRITLANWLRFNPLGELVNRHQQVGLLILGAFKGSYHVKPPSGKRPSDGNHP